MPDKPMPVRGTKDILPESHRLFTYIVETTKAVAQTYGFFEISTPIFEFTEIFQRSLGGASDIVNKEMYSFIDKGGNNLTLRPEFTASIVRAFISNSLNAELPLKLFSYGPLFRHERPQKGRQRQFHQINMEILGIENSFIDVELISMVKQLLVRLQIEQFITLEINSLGDQQTRDNYTMILTEFFNDNKTLLSEDSIKRLEKNPLRILDSKDKNDKKLILAAPKIHECYSREASELFGRVTEGLAMLGINYKLNPYLVRGLDYYCHTIFEFTTNQLGSQNAVIAGGRYDKLISSMGGPDTKALGCAGGIERLMELCELANIQLEKARPFAILPIDDKACPFAVKLAEKLRKVDIYCEILYAGNIGKRMKKANKNNAKYATVIGEDEISSNCIKIKNFDTGVENKVDVQKVVQFLTQHK